MKNTGLLFLILVLSTVSIVAQNKNYAVISGSTDTLQYGYFMNRLETQFNDRRERVEKANRSEKSLLARRDALRKKFTEMIGELPKKCPLNMHTTRKVEMDLYSIEAVTFQSQPNHHVTGLFYLPKTGKAPYPAVYIPCGHSKNGKAIEAYQKAARLFALNGFAVLQADPISQGERYQLLNEEGKPKTSGGTLMHEFFGQALALTGSSTLKHELYDNIRCIDFLEQHPFVDKNKIAVAGNSGGGTQATFLVAYDRRIKVATPSCFIASFETKMHTHGIGDFCQHTWFEGKYHMEEQDFLLMAAPSPIAILSKEKDFFSLEGAKTAYKELKKQYEVLGNSDKISHSISEGSHGWHQPNREAAVQWCKRWLLNDNSPVIEPFDIGFFNEEECLASPTGQVLTSFENERSMFDIIEDCVVKSRSKRDLFAANNSQAKMLEKIKELIGYDEPRKKIKAKNTAVIQENGYRIEKLLLERDEENNFYLPALLLVNDKIENESSAIIMVSENGKNSIIEEAIEKVKEGQIVLLIDISNTGELEDKKQFSASWSKYFTPKFPLHEGKTLLGYRVEDIVIATRFLQENKLIDTSKIELFSLGNTGYAALHAATISDYFKETTIVGLLDSWETVATESYHSQEQLSRLDNVIPNVLNYYDIPDLKKICFDKNSKIVQK